MNHQLVGIEGRLSEAIELLVLGVYVGKAELEKRTST